MCPLHAYAHVHHMYLCVCTCMCVCAGVCVCVCVRVYVDGTQHASYWPPFRLVNCSLLRQEEVYCLIVAFLTCFFSSCMQLMPGRGAPQILLFGLGVINLRTNYAALRLQETYVSRLSDSLLSGHLSMVKVLSENAPSPTEGTKTTKPSTPPKP